MQESKMDVIAGTQGVVNEAFEGDAVDPIDRILDIKQNIKQSHEELPNKESNKDSQNMEENCKSPMKYSKIIDIECHCESKDESEHSNLGNDISTKIIDKIDVSNEIENNDTIIILTEAKAAEGDINLQDNDFKHVIAVKCLAQDHKSDDGCEIVNPFVKQNIINNTENGDITEEMPANITADDCSSSSPVLKYIEDKGDENEDNSPMDVRFVGTFRSFREKKVEKSWRRGSLGEESKHFRKLKESTPELNRSQYSLVSCAELTPGAVQLWLQLPEEVKYDPALSQFRQLYEKEYGKDNSKKNSSGKPVRLPLVSSAPHLNNNLMPEDVLFKIGNDPPGAKNETLLTGSQADKKTTKMSRAAHLVKMTLLLACWMFFTAAFLMYNEKEVEERNTFISVGETKHYILKNGSHQLSVALKFSGPFLSDNAQEKLNDSTLLTAPKMDVWLEARQDGLGYNETSTPISFVLLEDSDLDFNVGETRSALLHLHTNNTASFVLLMRTSANATVPVRLSYTLNPIDVTTGVLYSCLLLCGLYVLIIFEVMNRTMAAVLLSTTSLAVLAMAGERPSLPEVIAWLDVETLLLLFSMMLLVAIMAETGMFDFLAVFTFEVTKGKLWPLITVLCGITAVLSTFLDNVTTVLLITPVTIRLCEVMDLDPIPILMSMVLFSNIGGTATPVGDPPNVIIASNKAVIQSGVNFTNFTLHMTLGILLVCLQTYLQLRFMFRDTNKMRICVPRDIQELRHQIAIWRRAADSLPHLSKDVHIVRERLERKVRKLQAKLEIMEKEANKRACPKDTFQSTLVEMKDKYKIRDKALLLKATVAICFVVAVFFLHSIPELNRVSLGWTALLGAILLLILADREDLEPILHRVEWSTLLFFAALFVLMEALSKLGLIEYIGALTETLILMVNENARLAVAILLILWVSGVTSAFVDNIPLTTMMVRVVTSLGSNPHLNLPMMPLIWALSFGACLGGNGTLIGASANVVCAGVAEQHGYKFTFVQFFKIGFPIMIGHLIVASGYLLLCHCVFQWH